MPEVKIGEIFKERGMTLRVEQSKLGDCDKCAFYGTICSDTQDCTPKFREDGQYVIFKEVEDAPEEVKKKAVKAKKAKTKKAKTEEVKNG